MLRHVAADDGWLSLPEELTWQAARHRSLLLPAARHHRLGAAAYLALRDGAPPDLLDLLEPLRSEHHEAVVHHARSLGTLHHLTDVLGRAGVRAAVLKGPALAVLSYPRPDIRRYGDLDVLVRRRDLATAVEALEGARWRLLDRNWDLLRAIEPGELHLLGPSGIVVDLHFELINNAGRRRRFRLDTAAHLERAEAACVPGGEVLTLDRVDTLLHLAVHTGLSGADRLGWFSDIDQTVRRRPPDWTELIVRAEQARVPLLVHLVLQRAVGSLATPVPEPVLAALSPSPSWSRAVDVALRVDRLDRSTGRPSPVRSLAREALPGTWATLGSALTRRGSALLSTRTPFAGDHADDPRSVLHDAGGATGRRQFLDSVAALDAG